MQINTVAEVVSSVPFRSTGVRNEENSNIDCITIWCEMKSEIPLDFLSVLYKIPRKVVVILSLGMWYETVFSVWEQDPRQKTPCFQERSMTSSYQLPSEYRTQL